ILVHLTGDPAAIVLRRSFGHSLVMLPLWSLLLALVLRRFYPRAGLRERFGLALLGASVHLFFDLVNSFGVLLLWPFSNWRPELAIVFIVDFVLAGLLAAPLLVCIPRRMRGHLAPLSRAALIGVVLYVLLCGANRALAARSLAAQQASGGGRAEFSYVFPEPLGPHRWRGVVRRGDAYQVYLIRPLSGRAEVVTRLRTHADDPLVRPVRETQLARRLERFFKAPVWEVREQSNPRAADPTEVCVHDLRFMPVAVSRPTIFGFCFLAHADGRVEGIAGRRMEASPVPGAAPSAREAVRK
ncbi:MAG: metal-dependent hydrolase, partial [Acidobacteria bacterium]|nr:metal-dependent hydrolase [Acidobacteriota bacterium]